MMRKAMFSSQKLGKCVDLPELCFKRMKKYAKKK